MLKRIFKVGFSILGGFIGINIFLWTKKLINTSFWPGEPLSRGQEIGMSLFFAMIFAFVFYRSYTVLGKYVRAIAKVIIDGSKKISTAKLILGSIGLIVGFILAFLLSLLYLQLQFFHLGTVLTVITYAVLGYLGVMVMSDRGNEIFSMSFFERKGEGLKSRIKKGKPKILDTSVIIDGRILDIMETGFLEGTIIIPEFVLLELQYIADSSDSLKRRRGRRGLDILDKIQERHGIEIYNTDKEKALDEIPDVDIKLLKLCQIMKGSVVTNDYNLNKVARLKEIEVLNINELANAVKPIVLPEEIMVVKPVKEGKDKIQALAYLDDGTMIVVEDGRDYIGKEIEIKVSKVLQTNAGKMIFGRVKKG